MRIMNYVLGIMKSPLPPGLDIIQHTESMVLLKRLEACLDICLQPAASEKDTIMDYEFGMRDIVEKHAEKNEWEKAYR